MTAMGTRTNSVVIPCLRYRDAPAAIEWLCDTFGFRRQLVVPHGDGTIAHAELVFGGGMVMLSSVVDSEFGRLMRQPDQTGGGVTQGSCLIVPDADVVYERAKLAGAAILLDIQDQSYGGRSFTCRDPEGHIWNVGTYDPWEGHGEASE